MDICTQTEKHVQSPDVFIAWGTYFIFFSYRLLLHTIQLMRWFQFIFNRQYKVNFTFLSTISSFIYFENDFFECKELLATLLVRPSNGKRRTVLNSMNFQCFIRSNTKVSRRAPDLKLDQFSINMSATYDGKCSQFQFFCNGFCCVPRLVDSSTI